MKIRRSRGRGERGDEICCRPSGPGDGGKLKTGQRHAPREHVSCCIYDLGSKTPSSRVALWFPPAVVTDQGEGRPASRKTLVRTWSASFLLKVFSLWLYKGLCVESQIPNTPWPGKSSPNSFHRMRNSVKVFQFPPKFSKSHKPEFGFWI